VFSIANVQFCRIEYEPFFAMEIGISNSRNAERNASLSL